MPDETTHRLQAEQNERLSRGLVLLSPQSRDWAVTSCFYAALHWVDGYLARNGIHPGNHVERERWVQRRLLPIRRSYWRLKHYSLHARYEGAQVTPTTVFQPAFVESLIATELGTIKDYIAGLR